MSFQIHALEYEPFATFFQCNREELERQQALLQVVKTKPGTPCRVSLQDAEPGETVLLVNHMHQPANTPFRASHAIYVRQNAVQARPATEEIPEMLRTRLLSVRAFSAEGMMLDADVVPGSSLETMITAMFENPDTATLHLHNARQGCYLARVERS